MAMIVPITAEQDWLQLIGTLPSWRPCGCSMVVVAPHPDDEILGVGGLIAEQRERGVDVTVIAVTDGEHAYPESAGSAALGRLRCFEQTAALERIGVPAEKTMRLRFTDSDVMTHVRELTQRLCSLSSQETHLVAPWRGDFHPDHEACGIAAEQAARMTGATLTSYFFWTWHRGTPELLRGLPLRSFSLSPAARLAKAEALQCHRSQLIRKGGDPILPHSLLAPAERGFEVFLPA